jgi:G-patch domain
LFACFLSVNAACRPDGLFAMLHPFQCARHVYAHAHRKYTTVVPHTRVSAQAQREVLTHSKASTLHFVRARVVQRRVLYRTMNGVLGKRAMKDLSARANDSAGSGYSSFAQKMMKNMGWQEGAGLGKESQGMASYIKVKRKDDDAGLGRDKAEQAKVTNQWYFGAFEDAIAAAKTLDTSMKKKLKKEKKQGKKVR